MDNACKLELHYYFDDESHSIDAHVRNKCEGELLAIIHETAAILGIDIKIDAEAFRAGGFKDIWNFLGRNGNQLTLILTVLAIVLSRVPMTDHELNELKKEETRLSIQEKKLHIKKLEQEIEAGQVTNGSVNSVAGVVDRSFKVITRKSNFYKTLSHYDKVTQIGISSLDEKNHIVGNEEKVSRSDFGKFIMHSNDLPSQTIDNAVIEIVSPVLKEGNYKWKGIYEEEPISFSMTDKEFKEAVLGERVSFQHGTTIECVLVIHKKLDEIGEVVITGYSVKVVIKKIDGSVVEETRQGKAYKINKKIAANQCELFNE